MMMKSPRFIPVAILAAIFIAALPSCSDMLHADPEDVLTGAEFYRDINDADAALRGIYGQFVELAPRFVVLNELRADLMDVTVNADHYMREIATHANISPTNPWADAAPFFRLINNCNSVIHNLNLMANERRISREELQPRVSDVIALRSWVYMQLAIHFGPLPYITVPIEDVSTAAEINRGGFPVLDIEQMMAALLADMEAIPYKGVYTDPSLFRVIDGFHTRLMFIDKEYLLGELHLWNGNYTNAATYFRAVMERPAGQNPFNQYKLPFRDDAQPANPGTSRYTSGYLRFFGDDLNSVVNFWPTMFREYGTSNYYGEWLWVQYFHRDHNPSPFFDIFSYYNGRYLLRPSERVMNDWASQIQVNRFTGDFRGSIVDIFLNRGSFEMQGGNPVITKFISELDPLNPLARPGKWFLWRAGGLHLRFAEAANRAGEHFLALALLNNGIRANYPGSPTHPANDFTQRNVTYRTDAFGNILYQDGMVVNLMPPFDFDARITTAAQIPPLYRGNWHRNIGVRGRVSLSNLTITPADDPVTAIEDFILAESGRELAFEGHRWADLVRVAIRRGDNSVLANQVAARFEAAGQPGIASQVRQRLMDRGNWFLPLNSNRTGAR